MSDESIYFVQISDTHIGPNEAYSRYGDISLPCAQRLVVIINNLPVTPDFVVHTGDVATDPDPAAYALAAKTFGGLKVPIYYVNGNHDDAQLIKKYLPMGPSQYFSADPDKLCYAFDLKGYRFLVLDAQGPAEIDPKGLLSPAQMEIVHSEAQPDGPPLIIFIHFPALPLDSIWMDNHLLIMNGEEFHQALLPARDRLRAVFYGHVHQSLQTFRDGILYVAAGSGFSQFASWPEDAIVRHQFEAPPAFNFVRLTPQQMIVNQHTFSRP